MSEEVAETAVASARGADVESASWSWRWQLGVLLTGFAVFIMLDILFCTCFPLNEFFYYHLYAIYLDIPVLAIAILLLLCSLRIKVFLPRLPGVMCLFLFLAVMMLPICCYEMLPTPWRSEVAEWALLVWLFLVPTLLFVPFERIFPRFKRPGASYLHATTPFCAPIGRCAFLLRFVLYVAFLFVIGQIEAKCNTFTHSTLWVDFLGPILFIYALLYFLFLTARRVKTVFPSLPILLSGTIFMIMAVGIFDLLPDAFKFDDVPDCGCDNLWLMRNLQFHKIAAIVAYLLLLVPPLPKRKRATPSTP